MIKELELINFRNHGKLKISDFSGDINILAGKNGEGKTNILEALYMLTTGKSFRTNYYSPVIRNNEQRSYASLSFERKVTHKIELLLEKGEKKSIRIDGQNIKHLYSLFSAIRAVAFCPEDLKFVKESPSYRRNFIDLEICRLVPSYIEVLKNYRNICNQKNRVLKGKDAEKLIDVYNEQMTETAGIIYSNRKKYMEKACNRANLLLKDMGKDTKFSYSMEDAIYDGDLKENIRDGLEKIRAREIEERCSLFGPHRTNITFNLNGKDTREYASQGEAGTLAVALKFAAAELIEEKIDEYPVLILDDVFSFLDDHRQRWVMEKSKGHQTFISIASESPENLPAEKTYFLKNGQILAHK